MNIIKNSWKTVCFLCIGIVSLSVLTGCNTGSNQEKSQTPSATPKKELVSQEDSTSNLGQWGRAMGSVLISINEGDVYYFGGYETTNGNQKAAAKILNQSWGITNRTDLLIQIQDLLKTGNRTEYRKEAKEMNAMSNKKLKTALKQLSGDTLIHYQMVQYNWKKWKKNGLLAWDLCRVSHLVQWGYVAGYISIEEAQALLEPAAQKLQKKFSSWDEVQQNWLDGYALFASIDASHPAGTDYEARQKVYETLKTEQSEDRLLYDDSLFQSEIIPINGISADTILAEVAK